MRKISAFWKWFLGGLQGADSLFLVVVIVMVLLGLHFLSLKRKEQKICRAEFVQKLVETIRTDAALQEFLLLIERKEAWFSKEFLEDYAYIKLINNGLHFFNYICYLEDERLLPRKEYAIFESFVLKIAENNSVQNYLYYLYHRSQKEDTVFSYYYLLDNCAEKMPGGFLDNASSNYMHV